MFNEKQQQILSSIPDSYFSEELQKTPENINKDNMSDKKRAITLTIYFEEGEMPENTQIGTRLNGGTITAIASYDLFATMEIAEEALETCDCDSCGGQICTTAIELMNESMRRTMTSQFVKGVGNEL